jgi:hypothetical protein
VRRALGQPPELPLRSPRDSALKYVHGVLERSPTAQRYETRAPAAAARVASSTTPPYPEWLTKSTWEHIRLTRDCELHIRRPLTREHNKLVDRLLEAARKIFAGED